MVVMMMMMVEDGGGGGGGGGVDDGGDDCAGRGDGGDGCDGGGGDGGNEGGDGDNDVVGGDDGAGDGGGECGDGDNDVDGGDDGGCGDGCSQTRCRLRVEGLGPELDATKPIHFKVHKVLRLPRSLRVKVHKARRLPRTLHFKVHKALRLPRNLHIKIHIAQPCQGESQQEHWTKGSIMMPKCCFRSRLRPVSENEPHVQKSRFTAPATKPEHAEESHHVQSTALAKKSVHRRKAAPISCTRYKISRLWTTKSLAPATNNDHQVRKCARHHNESAVLKNTRASPPDFGSLRSRNALRRSRGE